MESLRYVDFSKHNLYPRIWPIGEEVFGRDGGAHLVGAGDQAPGALAGPRQVPPRADHLLRPGVGPCGRRGGGGGPWCARCGVQKSNKHHQTSNIYHELEIISLR